MIETCITKMLGLRYPILIGPLNWLTNAEMAAAAAEAGSICFITTSTFASKEDLRAEIKKARSLTKGPIGVNISFINYLRDRVTPLEFAECCAEETVEAVQTGGGDVSSCLKILRDGGVKIIHKVSTVDAALKAENAGVDAVAVLGGEAGGYITPGGGVSSLILTPRAVDRLSIPVLASGGFSDGRGVAAALVLGAAGVLMGARFVLTKECPAHLRLKERLLETDETGITTIKWDNNLSRRVLNNQAAQEIARGTEAGDLKRVDKLKSKESSWRAWFEGRIDEGIISMGTSVSLVDRVLSISETLNTLEKEAEATIRVCGLSITG
jgi:NAD(P)H-dependent flavin oxidoreductase YrpB (nitropropane dioxygenase family)